MRPIVHSLSLALVVALAPALAPPAAAQCPQPDGLTGPCCQFVTDNLPQLPPAALPGLGICWDKCAPADKRDLRVDWTPPSNPNCGQYKTMLTVRDAGTGAPLLLGTVTLDYTRTWAEVGPAGNVGQVWRFVAKADLSRVAPPGPAIPCPIPSCLQPNGPYPTAFFYGYFDYARGCGQASFENALVLYHACDFFIHKPGLSSRPGVFHPDTSYAIVAPHSAAQPFAIANLPSPGGPLVAEAMRNVVNIPGAIVCQAEDPLAGGQLAPFAKGCLCPLQPVPDQVNLRVLQGSGTCPTPAGPTGGFQSQLIGFPVIPWPHLVTTSIGNWTNPNVYPGQEGVWVDEGLFRHRESCSGAEFFEVKYGASTAKGFQVIPIPGPGPVPPPSQNFTDLADNYTAPVLGTQPLPILGHVMPTDHLIYVNVP